MELFGKMSYSGSIWIVSFVICTYGYRSLTSADRPNPPPPQNAIFPDPDFGSANTHENQSLSSLTPPQISEIVEPGPREETPAAADKKESPALSRASSPLSDAPSPAPETVVGPKKSGKGKNKVPKKKADVSRRNAGVIAGSRKRSRSTSEDNLKDLIIVQHMIDLSGDLEDVWPYSVWGIHNLIQHWQEKAPESVEFDDRYLEKMNGNLLYVLGSGLTWMWKGFWGPSGWTSWSPW